MPQTRRWPACCWPARSRAAVDQLHGLIEETCALVELHLPDFDTSAARAVFDDRRVVEEGVVGPLMAEQPRGEL
jgi:hypothetical protein